MDLCLAPSREPSPTITTSGAGIPMPIPVETSSQVPTCPRKILKLELTHRGTWSLRTRGLVSPPPHCPLHHHNTTHVISIQEISLNQATLSYQQANPEMLELLPCTGVVKIHVPLVFPALVQGYSETDMSYILSVSCLDTVEPRSHDLGALHGCVELRQHVGRYRGTRGLLFHSQHSQL